MLYRGSEIMREVAWVIFDEIHYMRDKGMSWQRRILRFLRNGCDWSWLFFLIIKSCNKDVWSHIDNNNYAFCRTRSRLGRDYYPSSRQCALRIFICHDTQCSTVCWMDLSSAQTGQLGKKQPGFFVLITHIVVSLVKTAVVSLQPCHVVYTDYRPTPLQHYIFPAGGDGIHMVVDEQVSFWPSFF